MYKIEYEKEGEEKGSYIGKKIRKFKIRIKKHQTNVKFGKFNAALAQLYKKEEIKFVLKM